MEPVRVRTVEQLREILSDGQEHDFWCLLLPGLHTRRTLKLCKNGKFKIIDHASVPSYTYWQTEEQLTNEQGVIGEKMKHGNFAVAPA